MKSTMWLSCPVDAKMGARKPPMTPSSANDIEFRITASDAESNAMSTSSGKGDRGRQHIVQTHGDERGQVQDADAAAL